MILMKTVYRIQQSFPMARSCTISKTSISLMAVKCSSMESIRVTMIPTVTCYLTGMNIRKHGTKQTIISVRSYKFESFGLMLRLVALVRPTQIHVCRCLNKVLKEFSHDQISLQLGLLWILQTPLMLIMTLTKMGIGIALVPDVSMNRIRISKNFLASRTPIFLPQMPCD